MDYPLIIISDVLLCRVCFRGFAVLAVALRVILLRVCCGTGLTTGACDGIQRDAGRDGSVQ